MVRRLRRSSISWPRRCQHSGRPRWSAAKREGPHHNHAARLAKVGFEIAVSFGGPSIKSPNQACRSGESTGIRARISQPCASAVSALPEQQVPPCEISGWAQLPGTQATICALGYWGHRYLGSAKRMPKWAVNAPLRGTPGGPGCRAVGSDGPETKKMSAVGLAFRLLRNRAKRGND